MTAADVLERLSPAELGPRAALARAWIDRNGLPTTREEAWRHTPVDDIIHALLDTRAAEVDTLDPATLAELVPDLGGPRLVHVNGRVVPDLCRLEDLSPGLRVIEPDEFALVGDTADTDSEPADGFHALNWIAGHDVAGIVLEADAMADDVEAPLQIVHVTIAGDTPVHAHPRTEIRLGPRSRLQIVEHHVTTPGASVTNATTRIRVDDGAHLTHRRIVLGTAESIHVARVDLEQLADSTVSSTAVSIDGAIVRTGIRARLAGDGAHVDLDGLYVPVERQRHDTVVVVDHAASHGFSNQVFKGVIADRGRGSFLGHVIVRPDTVRNDARQSNPNLILDRSAQADTNPWLEIYADDVACTHGATVGRLDEDALFYLQSRGIPADQARTMLVSAFAGEVVHHLEPASLRGHIEALLSDRTPGGLLIEP